MKPEWTIELDYDFCPAIWGIFHNHPSHPKRLMFKGREYSWPMIRYFAYDHQCENCGEGAPKHMIVAIGLMRMGG